MCSVEQVVTQVEQRIPRYLAPAQIANMPMYQRTFLSKDLSKIN
jgi:hypothetical protein